MLILRITENKIQTTPRIFAYNPPLKTSIIFHTSTMVKAPNNAGKNFIQNIEFPNNLIRPETQEVNGGTEI